MSKIIVSPSILSADFANLERDIKRVEEEEENGNGSKNKFYVL